jgi:hypothetical protein
VYVVSFPNSLTRSDWLKMSDSCVQEVRLK